MMLIKNGHILCMNGKEYISGDILVRNGKIEKIGKNIENTDNCEEIQAEGKYILPGYIDAHCHVGIMEENMGFEGNDTNEATDPITPELRAIDGINPRDPAFSNAIKAGVTCVMTGPGSANVIGGQFCVMKTYGNCIDNMVIKAPAAMKIAFGENPKRVYNGKGKKPMTRMATAALLRETLIKANNYLKKKEIALEKGENFDLDIKMEALIPVLKGEIPLKAHAHRADDILTAIRIAKEFNLKLTLDHCTEGHLIKECIKDSHYPAIIGPTISRNSKIELANKSLETPKTLHEAGVKIAIMTDHPVVLLNYLPLCAALACKEGLSQEEALKAITINAAEILGIDHRVGSLEEKKDADIIILDGAPFDMFTKVLYTIIDGNIVYKQSKRE